MKTEDLINPIGIDEKETAIFLKLQSKISGTVQTAYRIIVRSDNDTVWDSGKELHLTVQSALNTTVSLYRL